MITKLFNLSSRSTEIFFEIFKDVYNSVAGEEFFLSREGIRKFARQMAMGEHNFNQSIYYLRRKKMIDLVDDRYIITPLGAKVLKRVLIEKAKWEKDSWDGMWKIVIFDIPEVKKRERNYFRGFLMRKGFIRLQDSVFVSPFIDYEAINYIRNELGIQKFVNTFCAKSGEIDDDNRLRKHFNLVNYRRPS